MIPSRAFYLALSEVLQAMRLDRNLTQADVAIGAGVHVKTVSANEMGRRSPGITLDNLLRYCHFYGVRVQKMIDDAAARESEVAARLAEEERAEAERRSRRRLSLRQSVGSGALRSTLDPRGEYAVRAGRATT